jgi:hypothetical protein
VPIPQSEIYNTMKIALVILFTVVIVSTHAQSFELPLPEGWKQNERIPFPIEFAPNIPYVGEEFLVFPPGWADVNSPEHWTYFFLWWIDKDSRMTVETLNRDFKEYYDGLVGRNIVSRKIDSARIVPTHVAFKAGKERGAAFQGTIDMLDYHAQRPIKLFVDIHRQVCVKDRKLAVFVSISPQPASHDVWNKFQAMRDGFKCVR